MKNRRQIIENQRANDERILSYGFERENTSKIIKMHKESKRKRKLKRKEKSKKKLKKIENYKTQTVITLE